MKHPIRILLILIAIILIILLLYRLLSNDQIDSTSNTENGSLITDFGTDIYATSPQKTGTDYRDNQNTVVNSPVQTQTESAAITYRPENAAIPAGNTERYQDQTVDNIVTDFAPTPFITSESGNLGRTGVFYSAPSSEQPSKSQSKNSGGGSDSGLSSIFLQAAQNPIGEAAINSFYNLTGLNNAPLMTPISEIGTAGTALNMTASNIVGGAIIGGITSGGIGGLSSSLGQNTGTGAGGTNFGGTISMLIPCTCGPSTLLYIGDVRGQQKQLLYTPGQSTLYSYGNLLPGANVLGTYTSGGATCQVYVGVSCVTTGSPEGVIQMVGTSAL